MEVNTGSKYSGINKGYVVITSFSYVEGTKGKFENEIMDCVANLTVNLLTLNI
jgi:hypothetical protein